MARDWFDKHLEEFVRPYLKKVPDVDKKEGYVKEWGPKHVIALLATWKEAKKKSSGRHVLLAGRDVFLFELLARLEDYPTTFRPDISCNVAQSGLVKEDYTQCYLLDTGFKGTVPKALGISNYSLIKADNYRLTPKEYSEFVAAHQVFPRAKGHSTLVTLAGKLEYVYKYWTQGYAYKHRGKIEQQLSEKEYFSYACRTHRHIVDLLKKTKGSPCS